MFKAGDKVRYKGMAPTLQGEWEIVRAAKPIKGLRYWHCKLLNDPTKPNHNAMLIENNIELITAVAATVYKPGDRVKYTGNSKNYEGEWEVVRFHGINAPHRYWF